MPLSRRRLRVVPPELLNAWPSDLIVLSDAASVVGVADGGNVTGWADGSGLSNHWTNGDSQFPKLRSTLGPNGGPCIEVGRSASDGFFVAPSAVRTALNTAAQAEIFIVLRSPNTASGNYGHWDFGTSVNSAHYNYNNADEIYETFCHTNRIGPVTPGNLGGVWRMYNVSSQGGSQRLRLDGTQIATGAFTFGVPATLRLGEARSFNIFDLRIAEVALFKRVLTDGERKAVNYYFAVKYGLTIA